ncbi:enolase C-terminal domain-like protein [Kribbella shirazensis]|uniref:Galactonate dehydratase n=1 Tax=Kribbella shirazensis TaxID=1105143 RepID=A0A7X6A5D7_9ACTN|nr:enolase C-terminal domain-like protein [Kribbella shirazensis]NIK62000.1 galactonate dehydratase [Kribbella shirazensis]
MGLPDSDVYVESSVVWSHRASRRSTWVMVEVVADGKRGVGELSDGGPLEVLLEAARSVSSVVVGQPVTRARTELRRRLGELRTGHDAFLWSTVLGGYEAAFADLLAQVEGRALSTSLGLGAPRPVRLYANLNRTFGGDGPDAVVAEAVRAVAAGFQAVKVAPFLDNRALGLSGARLIETGLSLVGRVRDAVPRDVELMVDCHHLVPAELLPVVVRDLAPLAPYWVEDLARAGDRSALEQAAAGGVALAAGEHIWSPEIAAAACAGGALRYWLVDPKHAGGPAGVAQIAEAVGDTQLTFHNPSGPVGTAHAAHLAGLAGQGTWLEFAWGEPDRADFLEPAEVVIDGTLRPAGPGIGGRPRGASGRTPAQLERSDP